jgi:hypothetical protein
MINYSVSTIQYPTVDVSLIERLGKASETLSLKVAELIGPGLILEPSFPEDGTSVRTYKYKTQITYGHVLNEDYQGLITCFAAEILESLQKEDPGKNIKPYRLIFIIPNSASRNNETLTEDMTFDVTSQITLV